MGRKKNPEPLMAQAYAAKNRVPFMMTYKDSDIRLADNISFEEYVPDSEDFIKVRDQMKKEVQKILVRHMSLFENLTVVEQHQNSDLMEKKSEMVSNDLLGSRTFRFINSHLIVMLRLALLELKRLS